MQKDWKESRAEREMREADKKRVKELQEKKKKKEEE